MRVEILETRQAPGVVAASSFLRRGYQACEFTQSERQTKNNKSSIATVAGDWVYIDGGEFSFLDDHGQTVYQLCKLFRTFKWYWC